MPDSILDERKKSILRAIVEDYIYSGEPVGSRTISRHYDLGISSATIRNDMSDLEELGYLVQPHTSAGRIPSEKGYRLYVDQLMRLSEMSIEEVHSIKQNMEMKIVEMDRLIRQTSLVLSLITDYVSLVTTPNFTQSALKAIQVVPLEKGKALVVAVAEAGAVRNALINIPTNVTPDFLINLSTVLNTKLSGTTIREIDAELINNIKNTVRVSDEILIPVLEGVLTCVEMIVNTEVYTEGVANIFKYHEFNNIMRARDLFNIMDERKVIQRLMNPIDSNERISVHIGSENAIDGINDCALITANYCVDSKLMGSIGIIGPTRMNYKKVIPAIRYIRRVFKREIEKFAREGKL